MVLDQSKILVSRLLKLAFCLLFTFPALPNALQSIVFAFFLSICIVDFFLNKRSIFFESRNYVTLFFVSAYYIFFLSTYFYKSSFSFSTEFIQPTFLLLLFPLILLFFNWTKDEELNKLTTLVYTVSSLYSFYLLYEFWVEGIALSHKYYISDVDFTDYGVIPDWKYIFKNSTEFLNSLADWGFHREGIKIELNTHHTFLSAVYTLNVIFILSILKRSLGLIERVFFLLVLLILSYLVYFLESKVNIACLIIIILCWIVYNYFRVITPKFRYVSGFVLFIMLLWGGQYLRKDKLDMIQEIESKVVKDPKRKQLYSILINEAKHKPIFGYGANNVKNLVDSVIKRDSSMYIFSFNIPTYFKSPHSQYLFSLLAGGSIQLVLFLLMFIYLGVLLLYRGNIFGWSFILLVGINCIFDDFLNRAWGVYLFCLGLGYFWNNVIKLKE